MAADLAWALRETVRIQDGRIPLLPRHLARLAAGGCDGPTLEAARQAALQVASDWLAPYGRLALVVARDGGVAAEVSDRPSAIDVAGGPVIAVVTAPEPALPPGAAKPADRSQWDRALALADDPGAHVAVLVSPGGRLIDSSHATLWLVSDEVLHTPPSPPALAGVSRGVVFEIAGSLGLEAREAALTPDDLAAAEEVVLTTALAGARGVRGRGGPVAEALRTAFDRLFASA